jgi:hypothetical protein
MNRRNFIAKASVGLIAGAAFLGRRLRPKYLVEYSCQFSNPDEARAFYGNQREAWEDVPRIIKINRELMESHDLLEIRKISTAEQWKWTYIFHSKQSHFKWEQRLREAQAVKRDQMPSGMDYKRRESWILA